MTTSITQPRTLECAKCGYQWQPRIARAPRECPDCKSRRWQAGPPKLDFVNNRGE